MPSRLASTSGHLSSCRAPCWGRRRLVAWRCYSAAPSSDRPPDPDIISRRAITRWGRRWRALDTNELPRPHLPGPHPALPLLLNARPDLTSSKAPGKDGVMSIGLPAPPARVLVPMCGASADISWLLHHGYQVVAVEAVPEAISALCNRFRHLELPEEPQLGAHDGFERYMSGNLAVYRGNFFQMSPVVLSLAGSIDWVWDRAALQLVPPEIRRAYVRVLQSLLRKGRPVYLVIESHHQTQQPEAQAEEKDSQATDTSLGLSERSAAAAQLFPEDSWQVEMAGLAEHTDHTGADSCGMAEFSSGCDKDGEGVDYMAVEPRSYEFSVLVCTKTVYH